MQKNALLGIPLAAAIMLPACGGDDNNTGNAPTKTSSTGSSSGSNGAGGGGQGGAGNQGGGGMAQHGLGAPCVADTDCAGGLCLSETDQGWPGGFCSGSCDTQTPACQDVGTCFDIGASGGLCLKPCTMGGGECGSGYACTDVLGDGSVLVCTPACTADAQCTTLGLCDTNQGICVAPETDCGNLQDDDGDGLIDCEDPTGCKGTAACVPGNTPTGHPCSAATDCAANGGDPACLSEAGFGYPGGYCSEFCNTMENDCASPNAICVARNVVSGQGMCVLSCATNADCPTAGYRCLGVGGGRKACTPSCTADSQCQSFCNLDKGACSANDEDCSDNEDNDVDGRIDCEDLDCEAACGAQITAACTGAIVMQGSIMGDTIGGTSLFSGSCTGSGAHEQALTITPGMAGQVGQLKLKLSSATDQGLYVRSGCGDRSTELGCADSKPAGMDEVLSVPVTGGVPVTVFIDGYHTGSEGPFTLEADFQQAICGDGAILLPEECDDGNAAAGDGCDAACHIEYPFYCMAAVPAAIGETPGDTTGGSSVFKGSCTGGLAAERMFSYTPPSSGTLHVELSSAKNMGLYIRTSCAAQSTELGCADSLPSGGTEVLDVPVTAGTPLTIFVDGHKPNDMGEFRLKLGLM